MGTTFVERSAHLYVSAENSRTGNRTDVAITENESRLARDAVLEGKVVVQDEVRLSTQMREEGAGGLLFLARVEREFDLAVARREVEQTAVAVAIVHKHHARAPVERALHAEGEGVHLTQSVKACVDDAEVMRQAVLLLQDRATFLGLVSGCEVCERVPHHRRHAVAKLTRQLADCSERSRFEVEVRVAVFRCEDVGVKRRFETASHRGEECSSVLDRNMIAGPSGPVEVGVGAINEIAVKTLRLEFSPHVGQVHPIPNTFEVERVEHHVDAHHLTLLARVHFLLLLAFLAHVCSPGKRSVVRRRQYHGSFLIAND